MKANWSNDKYAMKVEPLPAGCLRYINLMNMPYPIWGAVVNGVQVRILYRHQDDDSITWETEDGVVLEHVKRADAAEFLSAAELKLFYDDWLNFRWSNSPPPVVRR